MESRRRITRSGLTLVDLTITLMILAIFAAVTAPRFAESLRRFRVDAVAKELAGDLRYARHQARLSGKTQAVVFDVASNCYELVGVADIDRSSQPFIVDLDSRGDAARLVSTSFGPSGVAATLEFGLHGRPDFGGSVVVEASGLQRTITVDATTGKVSVL